MKFGPSNLAIELHSAMPDAEKRKSATKPASRNSRRSGAKDVAPFVRQNSSTDVQPKPNYEAIRRGLVGKLSSALGGGAGQKQGEQPGFDGAGDDRSLDAEAPRLQSL